MDAVARFLAEHPEVARDNRAVMVALSNCEAAASLAVLNCDIAEDACEDALYWIRESRRLLNLARWQLLIGTTEAIG